jgi:uncharacterized protein YjbJ (UPF0337 family)
MKPGTKDEIAGKAHEVKGTIKEKAGELTNDSDLEGEAPARRFPGKRNRKSVK